ncbi:MAG: transcription termination factor Rho [Clostridiales bacterium]|nr:transcription termination factor Rho [Clostridiales bacterium]
MDKLELALLLDNEQRKANEAEGPKEAQKDASDETEPSLKKEVKTSTKEKSRRTSSKKKAESVKEEKTPLEQIADVDSEEKIVVVDEQPAEEKKTVSKRGRKVKSEDDAKAVSASEDTSNTSVEDVESSKETTKKTSDGKKTGRKKGGKSDKKSEETKETDEEAVKTGSSEEKKETQEELSENPEKTDKKSRIRNKKRKSAEPVAETEEKKEETSEEIKKEEESEAAKPQEKPENGSNANTNQQAPSGKKNKKGRHRSVEIRPAGETEQSASDENGENTQDGENAPENSKPQFEPIEFVGVLEIVQEGGYGFVRRENYLPSPQDVFVPTNLIRRFGLRIGDQIRGFALPKRGQEKNLALHYITTVNDVEVDKLGRRPHFERLTPIYPDERFRLETGKQELSTRIIDLVSPIGKGQRGMIVSPPKAGKTILLQKIANAITTNSPKTKLIVLLIDERPEEVTDMQRSIKGEVVYSTFDKKPENHTRVTELVLERAMRLVEMGEDVVILLDSMTRLARAYNLTITPTGRTLSGGLDPGSLYGPKRFFGAARNIENGGSLTIVATSLIETGSRMDEVIFEEFKGTGNMEVYLDRKLSEKRIFPAIDINKSGTRREDLLMSQEELDAVWTIRKAFSQMDTAPVTETIIGLLLKTNSNDQFVRSVKVSFADKEVFDAMRGAGSSNNGNANN